MNLQGWQAGLVLGSAFTLTLEAIVRAVLAWRHYGYRRLQKCAECGGEVRPNGRGYGAAEYLEVCDACGDTSIRVEDRL